MASPFTGPQPIQNSYIKKHSRITLQFNIALLIYMLRALLVPHKTRLVRPKYSAWTNLKTKRFFNGYSIVKIISYMCVARNSRLSNFREKLSRHARN